MTKPVADEELVEGTLSGEEHAFAELYERYRRPVYSTAYRIIQNTEDAQDATQEIFVKLYRSLPTWNRNKAKFSTWLFRLACNQAIDYWRRRQRRKEDQMPAGSSEALGPAFMMHAPIRSPQRDVEGKERVSAVRRCVTGLPDLQKKVFVLRYFGEMKLEEIAEVEECNLGTVKTSLFRATQAVRRALRASGQPK